MSGRALQKPFQDTRAEPDKIRTILRDLVGSEHAAKSVLDHTQWGGEFGCSYMGTE